MIYKLILFVALPTELPLHIESRGRESNSWPTAWNAKIAVINLQNHSIKTIVNELVLGRGIEPLRCGRKPHVLAVRRTEHIRNTIWFLATFVFKTNAFFVCWIQTSVPMIYNIINDIWNVNSYFQKNTFVRTRTENLTH